MGVKQNIKKIGIIVLWGALGSGLLVLLVAAGEKKDHQVCKGVDINITGVGAIDFLDRKEVLLLLKGAEDRKLEGRPLYSFSLQRMEAMLEKNVWVKNAELFFDNNRILNVTIVEREPVALVFTTKGSSFYIDSTGKALPVNEKVNLRLPVFTSFPEEKTTGLSKANRRVLEDMKKLSLFLLKDSLWMREIKQLAVGVDGSFELLPSSEKYIIALGNGDDYEDKFHRLSLFNRNVLSKIGTARYNRIDVRFARQVVASRNGKDAKIDSLQTIKIIQKMITDATKFPDDTLFTQVEKNNTVITKADSSLPVLSKSSGSSNSNDKPRAVMPKGKKK